MKLPSLFISLLLFSFHSSFAEEISKEREVFNFTDSNGTPVFTDMKPKSASYKTKTIRIGKIAKPKQQNTAPTRYYSIQNIHLGKTTTIINNHYPVGKRRIAVHKKSRQKRRCNYYKARLERVMDKMHAGYRASEYKKLEKERVRYRKLLFDKCDTRLMPR